MASELHGPLLFPRTIRADSASMEAPLLPDAKTLESVHNLMKSLELRNPETIMNEVKRIMDDGSAIMQSDLTSFAETVGVTDAVAAPPKRQERARERRPGLGLKRPTFKLKKDVSMPVVNVKPTVNIDEIEDPDEFFDAFERMEKAEREIRILKGEDVEDVDQYKRARQARQRRPGILGKTYCYKPRYEIKSSRNDDMLISSQEKLEQNMEQNIPGSPKDDLKDEPASIDPDPGVLMEEDELNVPTKKTESEFSGMLEDLLSRPNDDLEGDGALNILQGLLGIKPLDPDNLSMPSIYDVGTTNQSITRTSLPKIQRSLLNVDSAKRSKRKHTEHENMSIPLNITSSPTRPRSPFASISLLQKKLLQSNPQRDPFSPLNINISKQRNTSPVRSMSKFHEVFDPKDLGMAEELDSRVEDVDDREPAILESQNVMQSVDSGQHDDNDQCLSTMLMPKDLSMSGELDSCVKDVDDREPEILEAHVMHNGDGHQHDVNDQSLHATLADVGSNEAPDHNIEKTMEMDKKQPNFSEVNERLVDNAAIPHHDVPEQQKEASQTRAGKGKRKARESRIKKAHPITKSIADAGTILEDGKRRTTRIRMRPLEYWRGERFLYECVDDSMKLIGVKYISPGKDREDIKVKPLVVSESSDYKELLAMAARH